MYPQLVIIELPYPQNIPMIDKDFDSFELNNDLKDNVREAETATFYHKTLDLE